MRRRVLAAALALGAAVAPASCAHAPDAAGVTLRVHASVPDATLVVDDVPLGRVADWAASGRHLRAGFHRVELRAPGFYSVYREIDARDGGSVDLDATLDPLLD